MTHVPELLATLDSIDLIPDEKNDLSRISKNLKILQSSIPLVSDNLAIDILPRTLIEDCSGTEWKYSLCLYQIILSIVDAVKFESDTKEDLLSTKQLNLLISCIQDVAVYGLRANLHPLFRSNRIFAPLPTENSPNTDHLKLSLEIFRRILAIRQFHSSGSLNEVIRDYIAGILTIIEYDLNRDIQLTATEKKAYQVNLNAIWMGTSKCDYFRNILLLKGLPNLPPALQKRLHMELLNKLMSKSGFANFVSTLVAKRTNADFSESEYFEIVANIVAHKGHTTKFYNCMIEQIFEFVNLCISNQNMSVWSGAGLLTLKRLYELKDETRNMITAKLDLVFKKLTDPDDVISGLIVMECRELTDLCNFIFTCFCTSSVECLPSELLTKYLPLLLNVYSYIPDNFREKIHIRGAIIRCLANRSRPELEKIVNNLVSKQYPEEWVNLYPRVSIRADVNHTQLTVKIGSPDAEVEPLNISNVLPEVLLSSNHNILTYVVFMCLLGMMQEALSKDDSESEAHIDLLHNEEELVTFLNSKYPMKVEIILCLSALVEHPSLKTQISENSSEFLTFLRTFIQRRSVQSSISLEGIDHTLLLMLTIIQEIIENSDIPEKYRDFSNVLRELRKQTLNKLIVHRIDKLLHLLDGGLKASVENKTSQYNVARDLMKEPEPHLKVYGINLMIEMLRRKEKDALANGHVTLALALHALKETESYTFLNCVRLLVALVNVMETEVLETLSHEYLNKGNKMDYRLVVGETILKICKELGQLSYKYKDVLINCFIHGSRSEVDEFRWSSFSNLATLCRTLSFQVQSFFQELIVLIENEVETGKYVPAKRAAVLVLSELLLGIDNLLDHEEYLLPIYRVLKTLSTNSEDEKIRIHAANGLKALGEKCKKFFFPEETREKEIKIIGIKDPPTKKSTGHILELN